MYRAFSWRSRSSLVFKKILKAYSKMSKNMGETLMSFFILKILWFRLLVFHRKTSVKFLSMFQTVSETLIFFSSWRFLWFHLLVFYKKTSVNFFLFMFRHVTKLSILFFILKSLWFRLLVFHRKTSVNFFYLCLCMWRNFQLHFSSWSLCSVAFCFYF